ncbi:MAG: hypothetical protein CSA03_02355 [Bacteroidetes bacterium]|nr:MAG: hypothetical protein CSA03_02355 [Bacteroidota bacterium]
MKCIVALLILFSLGSCSAQLEEKATTNPEAETEVLSEVEKHYQLNDTVHEASISKGSVSKGELIHGRIVPFSGKNFHYFDTTSYLADRGFTHQKVLETVLTAYEALDSLLPNRHFCLMECSHKHGGKLFPHRTHQNGLSVDFMMPKLKNGEAYYGLDDLGAQHYMLTFDKNGVYSDDTSVELDFNTIALHILQLQSAAKQNGLSIEKVIINTDLKDELFATENGKKLKASGIYVVRNLTPLINSLHDDHFHVDFRLE